MTCRSVTLSAKVNKLFTVVVIVILNIRLNSFGNHPEWVTRNVHSWDDIDHVVHQFATANQYGVVEGMRLWVKFYWIFNFN